MAKFRKEMCPEFSCLIKQGEKTARTLVRTYHFHHTLPSPSTYLFLVCLCQCCMELHEDQDGPGSWKGYKRADSGSCGAVFLQLRAKAASRFDTTAKIQFLYIKKRVRIHSSWYLMCLSYLFHLSRWPYPPPPPIPHIFLKLFCCFFVFLICFFTFFLLLCKGLKKGII